MAADIHQHLGLHARKVNEIFLRFYGVSASTYLREYKCKVLFVQILMAPKNLQQDHYPAAGMTGSPGEKRAFKSLYGVSVDDHWSRSQAESSRDHPREPPPSQPAKRAAMGRRNNPKAHGHNHWANSQLNKAS